MPLGIQSWSLVSALLLALIRRLLERTLEVRRPVVGRDLDVRVAHRRVEQRTLTYDWGGSGRGQLGGDCETDLSREGGGVRWVGV